MAYPNFEAWLVDYLQKSCGFNPEDANEIKDEIIKNIEWYRQQAEKEKAVDQNDQLADMLKKILPVGYPNTPTTPAIGPWTSPPSQPWKDNTPYIGDPLPGQEPTTWSDTGKFFAKKYYSNFGFNEKLSKRKDDSPDH